MPDQPDVTAIVVSWNVREHLRRCLASLENSRNLNLRTIVVDNGSTDGSPAMVSQEFPNVRLIANPDNRGFATAVNQGLAESRGNVALINPDLQLFPETLRTMDDAFQRHPRVGIVGPVIHYSNGRLQPSVRRFPSTFSLVVTLSKIANFAPQLLAQQSGLVFDYTREQTVDQVMGSCFLIRRAVINEIGMFDEGFFVWYEEVDFSKRAIERNWQTLFLPSAKAIHQKGASFSQVASIRKHRYLRQSMTRYAHKHLGRSSAALVQIVGLLTYPLAALQQLLNIKKPVLARDL